MMILPAVRIEIPGKSRLLAACGVMDDSVWTDAPMRSVRCKWNAGRVRLDTSERWERLAFFLGRYHELPLLLLMKSLLHPGDVFVDVGANLGLVSLYAAARVGPTGRVFAYEPNPRVFARLKDHLEQNARASVVTAYMVALGDARATLELTVLGKNTGSGTLGSIPPRLMGMVQERYTVPVVPGAEHAGGWRGSDPTRAPSMIKIDAEGSETRIVRGLSAFLADLRPVVVTEVNPTTLRMNNSSPEELRRVMLNLGYRCWTLDVRRVGVRGFRLSLGTPASTGIVGLHDLVWVHSESEAARITDAFVHAGA